MNSLPAYIGNGPGQFSAVPALLPYRAGEWMGLANVWYTALDGKTHLFPQFAITDLASIPWLAEPLFDGVDSRLPGIFHDLLYCFNQLSRAECDALLLEMLLATGCDRTRANLIYAGVRVGGWYRYNQCKGGPKREDFAWEYMSAREVLLYESAYKLGSIHSPERPARSVFQGLITDGVHASLTDGKGLGG